MAVCRIFRFPLFSPLSYRKRGIDEEVIAIGLAGEVAGLSLTTFGILPPVLAAAA